MWTSPTANKSTLFWIKTVFCIDTNILLHAAIEELEHYRVLAPKVDLWRKSNTPWHATWSIFYEFIRVATHPSIFKKPLSVKEAWSFLKAVMESESFSILLETEKHSQIIEEIMKQNPSLRGSIWHDVHIVTLMQEHGIKEIYTLDTGFYKIKKITVLNPLEK